VNSVAIVGSLSLDSAPGREPFPGGCPYHAARALSLLTRPSRIVAKCSPAHRRLLLGPVLALGIPVGWHPAEITTGFELIRDDDRRVMSVTSVGDSWTVDEVRSWVCKALEPCEWVHVAPLLRDEFSPAALAEIARGRILSLDGQGLARLPKLGPLELDADFDRELLHSVSVLKLSEREAEAILHEVSAESLASLGVPEVIVTRGSRGALIWSAGELNEVPAKPPLENAAATGAGDAFAAIYIAARSHGRSPLIAARSASVFVGAMLSRRLAPAQLQEG
jgi:sugar/nucleoside kinase (ribokinase family)